MDSVSAFLAGIIGLALLIIFFWLMFRIKNALEELVRIHTPPSIAKPAVKHLTDPIPESPHVDNPLAKDDDLGELTETEVILLKNYGRDAVRRARKAPSL